MNLVQPRNSASKPPEPLFDVSPATEQTEPNFKAPEAGGAKDNTEAELLQKR